MNRNNMIGQKKATLIHFNDIVEKKRVRAKKQEAFLIIDNLLGKLDLFRIKLSETHTSIHDIQPLVYSMNSEKKRLSDCRFFNDKELSEIITSVIQLTDTELEPFEKGYYTSFDEFAKSCFPS